jgi:hypothetical protein
MPRLDKRRSAVPSRYLALAGNRTDFGTATGGQYYLYDRSLATFEPLDVGIDGAAPNDVGPMGHIAISADARYVDFVSAASNLVPGDTNGQPDIFVRDRATATTLRISVRNDGSQLADGAVDFVASAKAVNVAFFANAFDMFGTGSGPQVFVRDIAAGTTTHASPPPPGQSQWPVQLTRLLSVDDRGHPFFGTSVDACTYDPIGNMSVRLIPPGPSPSSPYIGAYHTRDEQSSVAWTVPYESPAGHFVSLTLAGREGM